MSNKRTHERGHGQEHSSALRAEAFGIAQAAPRSDTGVTRLGLGFTAAATAFGLWGFSRADIDETAAAAAAQDENADQSQADASSTNDATHDHATVHAEAGTQLAQGVAQQGTIELWQHPLLGGGDLSPELEAAKALFGQLHTIANDGSSESPNDATASPSSQPIGSSTSATVLSTAYASSMISVANPVAAASSVVALTPIQEWSASWRAAVAQLDELTGASDETPAVLNTSVSQNLLSSTGPVVTATAAATATNPIVLENQKQGNPQSEWGIDGAGSTNIEGFATDISVNHGAHIDFKINTDSTHYRIDIYRIGYYNGDGARKVASIDKSLPTVQVQPVPLFDAATKLVDAGNWNVSAGWDVPADAVSGVYFAKLTRLDGVQGENIIPFIVRDDNNPSDITFQTSDTTWQAYNPWGGYNLYGSIDGGLNTSRGFAVSYNRPITTRGGDIASGPQDFIFGVEYPAIRWLEQNGYSVNYISGVDTARAGAQLLNSKIFLSVGHDEYWSTEQRANVEAARDAGVNLAFWSGNEVYWTTRWETSIDGSGTPYRTLVTYKEIRSNADVDANGTTSTWRDPVYGPGNPENALTGTMFTVDSYRSDAIKVPYELSNFRFWTNTAVSNLQPGQVYTLTQNLLGYEWDSDIDNGFRPAGLVNLSNTTLTVDEKLLDYGTTTGTGTATHALTLYRAASGALVFGAGTVYWAWGLDDNHDLEQTPVDVNVQQAMVNLFADMGVQPSTLMASLALASKSTDKIAPTSHITTPVAGTTFQAYKPITITGTATDTGGGIVAVVEVSTDGGAHWHRATGFENWSYTFTPTAGGAINIKTRAVDDTVNVETVGAGLNITVNQPVTKKLFTGGEIPAVTSDVDTNGVNLGVKFTSSAAGTIVGLKYYRGGLDAGDHVGSLWSSAGTLLASATFTNETTTGWQTVTFSSPVTVTAGASYVASYHSNGHYADTAGFFANGYANGPITVAANGGIGNSYYLYGANAFPTQNAGGTNYWVDVLFVPSGNIANTAPVAGADTVLTQQSKVLKIAGAQLRANDTDADNDRLAITGVSGAVNGTVTYDAATDTVTFTPAAGFKGTASFTYQVTDGTATSNGSANVNVVTPYVANSLLPANGTPAVTSDPDTAQVNLGVKFVASETGLVYGVKFYKGVGDTGLHTGSLWTSTGQLLATAYFAGETASGWQEVTFSSPITVTAGTTYVASYHSNGHYAATGGQFAATYTNGSLSTSGPSAGVYAYGATDAFPASQSNANYWVDVLFVSTGAPTAHNDSGFTTLKNAALTFAPATLLANDTDPNGDALTITGAASAVGGSVAFNTTTKAITFTPTAGYYGNASFTYSITDGTNTPVSAKVDLTVLPAASSSQLFAITDTPATLSDPDTSGVNLGMDFVASTTGTITGLKFYKGLGDAGTHVGSLWSSTGTLLANATFTNETDSGWQYVMFSAPVSVTAGTHYVASYHSNGHYTSTGGYFNTAHTSGALTAGIGASKYAYGATNAFPTNGGNGANYWVDVVFDAAAPAAPVAVNDSGFSTTAGTAVTISAASLLGNDTDANGDVLSIAGVVSGTGGTAVYNAATKLVTFTPTTGYTGAASFTYTATDGALTSNAATVALTVNAAAVNAQGVFSDTAIPGTITVNDPSAVELGFKFRSDIGGTISAIQFYKGPSNTGTHDVNLWASDGTLLAHATSVNETATGWQTVQLAQPVTIAANTSYVASYHTNGFYSASGAYFGADVVSGHLTAPSNAVAGGNGLYHYGANSVMPDSAFNSTNYWVDVVFNPFA